MDSDPNPGTSDLGLYEGPGCNVKRAITTLTPASLGMTVLPVDPGAVLRLQGFRDFSELSPLAYPGSLTLDHEIETVIERVAPGRQDGTRVLREVPGFALGGTGAEVQGAVQPYSQHRSDVRTSVWSN